MTAGEPFGPQMLRWIFARKLQNIIWLVVLTTFKNISQWEGLSHMYIYIYIYIRRKFRSQTSDNMDRWKAEMERVREKRKSRREKSRREKSRRKKIQVREKVGKSRNTMFFQWFVAPEGLKSRLAKAAGAEPSGQMRDEKVHAVVARRCAKMREAHFEVKMRKTHKVRTTFGSCDVEKVHAVVARSTFRSQNNKPHQCRTSFGSWDVEKVHAVVVRSTFPTLHYTTLHYTTITTTQLHSTTLNYTTLHYITFHYTPYTTLRYTTLHYTEWHCTTDRQIDRQTHRQTDRQIDR